MISGINCYIFKVLLANWVKNNVHSFVLSVLKDQLGIVWVLFVVYDKIGSETK